MAFNSPPVLQIKTKRRVYFAFHYADIFRVNNVRNAWLIDHPDASDNRGFYDSSLWEAKKLAGDDALKGLIRDGVTYTSAVCVLVGSQTYQRRWVLYEIARSVIDNRGLLAVHINGLIHHKTKTVDDRGYNPLHIMGLSRRENGKYYLCRQTTVFENGQWGWKWEWYSDYVIAVDWPKYGGNPPDNAFTAVALSSMTVEYDFAGQQGHKNIGGWIDLAAQEAGR